MPRRQRFHTIVRRVVVIKCADARKNTIEPRRLMRYDQFSRFILQRGKTVRVRYWHTVQRKQVGKS